MPSWDAEHHCQRGCRQLALPNPEKLAHSQLPYHTSAEMLDCQDHARWGYPFSERAMSAEHTDSEGRVLGLGAKGTIAEAVHAS